MPTTRPRHMITETDEISEAIERAKKRWPELAGDKNKLLKKMLQHSALAIEMEQESARNNRLGKIYELAGSMDEIWPENWREEARAEWPA